MPNWLLIIIRVLGTTVLVIIVSTIWYFSVVKLQAGLVIFSPDSKGKIRPHHHLLTSCTH